MRGHGAVSCLPLCWVVLFFSLRAASVRTKSQSGQLRLFVDVVHGVLLRSDCRRYCATSFEKSYTHGYGYCYLPLLSTHKGYESTSTRIVWSLEHLYLPLAAYLATLMELS